MDGPYYKQAFLSKIKEQQPARSGFRTSKLPALFLQTTRDTNRMAKQQKMDDGVFVKDISPGIQNQSNNSAFSGNEILQHVGKS